MRVILVAIVGILAAVAAPAYTKYMARGKIVEAHSALTTARIQMEQYYQDNRTYVGATCPAATTYFSYACTLAANTFTVTASSAANQGLGEAGSYVYTINESNVKTTDAFPDGEHSTTTWISK